MASNEAEGRELAEQFRREHGLGSQPVADLASLVERTMGIDVAVLDAPDGEHGLTMHDPDSGRTLIGVARTPHPMRLRSTLAHELAHALFCDWLAVDEDLGERRPAEIRADAFARHLLVPIEGLVGFVAGRTVDESLLSDICQTYGVSPTIATIALSTAGLIDEVTARESRQMSTPSLASRHGWRDHYRQLSAQSDQHRAPQRLLARAIAGYQDEVVSAQALASLRRLPLEQVQQELDEAGIRPHEDVGRSNDDQEWRIPASAAVTGADLAELDALLGGGNHMR